MLKQKMRRAYVRILYKNKEPEKEKNDGKNPRHMGMMGNNEQ